MTCILGYVDPLSGKVIIGGDSAATGGGNLRIRKDKKVFIKDVRVYFSSERYEIEKMAIGFSTSYRMGQILKHGLNISLDKNNKDTLDGIIYRVVDRVRELFKERGFLKNNNGREEGGDFMVGFRNRLFTVYDSFQIAENELPYNAIGGAASYAMGAMSILERFEPDLTGKEKVQNALMVAAEMSIGVSGPFDMIEV